MGGQSYKCPNCGYWGMTMRHVRDHLRDKHGLRYVQFEANGPFPKIKSAKEVKAPDAQDLHDESRGIPTSMSSTESTTCGVAVRSGTEVDGDGGSK